MTAGPAPEGIPVLYSPSPGDKAPHFLAEARVRWRDDAAGSSEGMRDHKAWFVLPLLPRGADWIRLETAPRLGPAPPESAICPLPPNFDANAALADAEASLISIAPRLCAVEVLANRHAGIRSAPGEDREAFVRRCAEALEPLRLAEGDRFRKGFEQKIERFREQTALALQRRHDEREEELLREQEDSINVLEAGLGALFGSRRPAVQPESAPAASLWAEDGRRPQAPQAAGLAQQIRGLQVEMDAEARRIARKFGEMAAEITRATATPERRDFRIEQLSLVWMGTNEVH